MKISEHQKRGLKDASQTQFYEEMCAFFAKEEPDLFATLSDEEQMSFAKACHRRCEPYGLQTAASIYAWADFSILVGSYFYCDPFFRPLIAEIERADVFTEEDCMQRAREWLTGYLAAVRGPENKYAAAALGRMQAFHAAQNDPDTFALPDGWQMDAYLAALCREIYPELADFHGEALVLERVRHLLQQSHRYYDLRGPWHLCSMTLLGMSFGTGFDFDELYPWIQRSLSLVPKIGPEASVERLTRRASIWVSHVLEPAKATS